MKFTWTQGAVLMACVAVSSCGMIGGGQAKAPKGQVVATVNGEEITLNELNRELGGASSADPAQRKAMEQAALQAIVNRKLAAQAAKEQKLDKTQEFALLKAAAEEGALVGALQRKVASTVPNPTRKDAEVFVSEHPDMFAQRKLMVVDQIIVNKFDQELTKAFEPLKSLGEVEAMLSSRNADFQRTTTILDTLSTPEGLTQALAKLPPGEVFIFPRNNVLFVNQIRDSRAVPFVGEPAIAFATNGLKQVRTQEALGRELESLRKAADGKITYNDKYKPEPPKPGAKPAAPALTPAPAPGAAPAAAPVAPAPTT